MYKSAVMVSGRCLFKILQNQNESQTSGARGGACRISAFTSGGRKFHHCQNQAAGVFLKVRCTEHNRTKWFAESLCFSMNLGVQLF